jgi:hypothetical protein
MSQLNNNVNRPAASIQSAIHATNLGESCPGLRPSSPTILQGCTEEFRANPCTVCCPACEAKGSIALASPSNDGAYEFIDRGMDINVVSPIFGRQQTASG